MSMHDDDLRDVLAECDDDAEHDRLRALWDRLGDLEEPEPTPGLAARFAESLPAGDAGRRSARPDEGARMRTVAAALAAGLFVGVVGTMQLVSRPDATARVAALERQRDEARRALVLASRPGAAGRLTAIDALAAGFDEAAPDALAAVVATDPNVNVRLVAARALEPYLGDAGTDGKIAALLDAAEDPLVRIALLDLVVAGRVEAAAPVLARLADDDTADPVVRDKAGWALDNLRRRRNET